MASSLNGIFLVAAVLLVLLHPSMERQPGPPAHHCRDPSPRKQPSEGRAHHCDDDDTDQPPAPPTPAPAPPTPTPAPTPLLPPTPAPTPSPSLAPTPAAPSPAVDCPVYCGMKCTPVCQARQTAGAAQCQADFLTNGKGCYDSCSNSTCSQSPDKTACLNSGCSYDNCTCDNTFTRSCCQWCGQAIGTTYNNCLNSYSKGFGYCMMDCIGNCEKNCTTQG